MLQKNQSDAQRRVADLVAAIPADPASEASIAILEQLGQMRVFMASIAHLVSQLRAENRQLRAELAAQAGPDAAADRSAPAS